MLQASSNFDTL